MDRSTPAPRVRVIVVNFNGGDMTLDCLAQLRRTEWPADRLELVLVDNASSDGVTDAVMRRWPDIRVVANAENVGFAGACNVGMLDLADVGMVALINNDVRVSPEWLAPLAAALAADPRVGAACPKILFANPYIDVALSTDARRRGRWDSRLVGVQLWDIASEHDDLAERCQFVHGFWGPEYTRSRGVTGDSRFQWTHADALLRVPAPPSGAAPIVRLRLSALEPTALQIRSGTTSTVVDVTREPSWFEIEAAARPSEIVNNAGSMLTPDRYGADRCYFVPDGRCDEPLDVFAWCGGGVLLARAYLDEVGHFDEHLFLYYEDFELSWRGRARGWRYRYVPDAVIRHIHAATAGKHSRLARYQNERNRLLVLTRHDAPRTTFRAVFRFILVTLSYLRRDVLARLVRAERPSFALVSVRVHALFGYLIRVPRALVARRRDRRAARVLARTRGTA